MGKVHLDVELIRNSIVYISKVIIHKSRGEVRHNLEFIFEYLSKKGAI